VRISYLELRNYRRFRDLKLQFPDGIVGILGLNGVGKTTIIEGIAWALFGNVDEVVRTSRESVKRAGAGPNENCSAVLVFELGDAEYTVVREMGGKSLSMKAELRSKGTTVADGDKPVRKMVEKLLGMDHKSFFTSVFARQKELNALQSVAAGERKKVVLRMLRIDGIDAVLTDIRSDKRTNQAKIEGAQGTLLTEDGREKEKVLAEKIPALLSTLELAKRELDISEKKELGAARDMEVVRRRRDELKKDVEAYNSSMSDLKAKQSALKEKRKNEESILEKIASAETKLKRLPTLEAEDEKFKDVSEKRDSFEREKARHEKARSLAEEIRNDESEAARRAADIKSLGEGLAKSAELDEQISDLDRSKTECEAARSEVSGRIGELRAKAAERREAAEKDRKKLEEIKDAGKEGICPTCERTLEEAYDLLVVKLTKSASDAERQAKEANEGITKLGLELEGLSRKEEAVKKKRTRLEQELTTLRQQEVALSERSKELDMLGTRMSQRRKTLSELGEVKFDEDEHKTIKAEYERLRSAHDEHTKLRSLKEQNEQHVRDLDTLRESIKRFAAEEEMHAGIVKDLEPKKELYYGTIKELDEKTATLNTAKDAVRKQGSIRDKAQADLDGSNRQLEEIVRVKKNIEEDRKRAEDLALLEDVIVNFKDNLIGRIAPTLSELTSRDIAAMTDGKYSKVELDENYEMQMDDQGIMYPISRFSGGEADLANLSLRLAISSIIADRTGSSPINILILDEIFGSQDPNRKRSVMTALSRLSTQFRQIFLITHIEDVKDSMNYVIKVEEQEDGTSTAMLSN
jgi:exonuclease SbcC